MKSYVTLGRCVYVPNGISAEVLKVYWDDKLKMFFGELFINGEYIGLYEKQEADKIVCEIKRVNKEIMDNNYSISK